MLTTDKTLVLVCIGTTKHHVDCIAPLVGKLIEKKSYPKVEIMYCDQTQIKETKEKLDELDRSKYQVLSMDIAFDSSNKKTLVRNVGIKPALLINKDEETVLGDCSVIINVKNVYSGSLKNQQRKLFRNVNTPKVYRRVDFLIKHTYLEIDRLIKALQLDK